MFPLKDYAYNIPVFNEAGAFGVYRKHDIHTGIDLYTQRYQSFQAIEDGIVVNYLQFTGTNAGSPWWHDTFALMIEGKSGVILYGEVGKMSTIEVGGEVKEGEPLGSVQRVLKVDKGIVPSTTMLHMELYKHGVREPVWWHLYDLQPDGLLDITPLLLREWKK